MLPRMTTRSAGQPAAASRGGGTGGQVGGQGSEVNDGVGEVPDFSTIIAEQLQNLLPAIVAQVGDQGRGQGNRRNQNCDAINDNIQGDVSRGCTYKEFLAFNHKEYDGHAAYTNRFHELARLVPHLVTPKGKKIKMYAYGLAPQIRGMVAATEPKTIQKAVQIAGTLTDEALRNESIKKNHEKRGNGGEPSKDRNVRDDNKRTRTGNAFATTTNPVGRENTGHFAKDCRDVPRNVNLVNARNPTARACYECGSTDYIRSACPRLNRAQGPGGNRPN
ncbi:hypothetical protein Tco_1340897 [Tanacetum coccineum]